MKTAASENYDDRLHERCLGHLRLSIARHSRPNWMHYELKRRRIRTRVMRFRDARQRFAMAKMDAPAALAGERDAISLSKRFRDTNRVIEVQQHNHLCG